MKLVRKLHLVQNTTARLVAGACWFNLVRSHFSSYIGCWFPPEFKVLILSIKGLYPGLVLGFCGTAFINNSDVWSLGQEVICAMGVYNHWKQMNPSSPAFRFAGSRGSFAASLHLHLSQAARKGLPGCLQSAQALSGGAWSQ